MCLFCFCYIVCWRWCSAPCAISMRGNCMWSEHDRVWMWVTENRSSVKYSMPANIHDILIGICGMRVHSVSVIMNSILYTAGDNRDNNEYDVWEEGEHFSSLFLSLGFVMRHNKKKCVVHLSRMVIFSAAKRDAISFPWRVDRRFLYNTIFLFYLKRCFYFINNFHMLER